MEWVKKHTILNICSLTSVKSALRLRFAWAELESLTSLTKDGWNEDGGWLWLPSQFIPEANQAMSADRKRLWQAIKKFFIPGNTPCQQWRWYAPIGLKRRLSQTVMGWPTVFAGIPQGGEGALAPVCCMRGRKYSKRTECTSFVDLAAQGKSCRVDDAWTCLPAYRDSPDLEITGLDIHQAPVQAKRL